MKHGKSRIRITATGGSADVEKNHSGSMTLVCHSSSNERTAAPFKWRRRPFSIDKIRADMRSKLFDLFCAKRRFTRRNIRDAVCAKELFGFQSGRVEHTADIRKRKPSLGREVKSRVPRQTFGKRRTVGFQNSTVISEFFYKAYGAAVGFGNFCVRPP